MSADAAFRPYVIAIFAIVMLIALPYRVKSQSTGEKLDRMQEGFKSGKAAAIKGGKDTRLKPITIVIVVTGGTSRSACRCYILRPRRNISCHAHRCSEYD